MAYTETNHPLTEWATALAMPALTGTPRQIAAAEIIRRNAVVRDFTEEMDINPKFAPIYQERLVALLAAKTTAAWWLDNSSKMGDWRRLLRTLSERGGGTPIGTGAWTPDLV